MSQAAQSTLPCKGTKSASPSNFSHGTPTSRFEQFLCEDANQLEMAKITKIPLPRPRKNSKRTDPAAQLRPQQASANMHIYDFFTWLMNRSLNTPEQLTTTSTLGLPSSSNGTGSTLFTRPNASGRGRTPTIHKTCTYQHASISSPGFSCLLLLWHVLSC